jgi:hypothetical protein
MHRKIYEKEYGPIPKDVDGRSYEIHHIDGNRANNDIMNLTCVTIQEHYNIHYSQGDYGACVMIAKRMGMSPTHLSDIQKRKKRPGIGGVKKGTIPWNKGRSGYRLPKASATKKGKVYYSKLGSKIHIIIELYNSRPYIDDVGKIQRNGKILSYEQAFSKKYAKQYNVTPLCIKNIITSKSFNAI